ncbi:maleylpyruvate isomerase N-terminal domain-containing protein [Actinophytocola sp.]|uniref:maleylpyruvate isomerase N-terminal domain-containing protein n=1 Tax=Actinophytocola sp. TaxID=1872138 RepID=UPI002D758452|nr:maleylpyruvate isomerase N-terminal domain-containing protein [Actinophytocola sp.]HYQ70195.1 maleylpyruvate isomerase N-terminal domain-containing protein [Actinophytocola sp.]
MGRVEGISRSLYRNTDRDTLADLWRCWHEAGLKMPGPTWKAPSGLGEWTVRELYAHVGRGVWTLADLLGQPPLGREPGLPDAAGYFAALRSLGVQGAAQVAETASAWAGARTDDVLVDAFDVPAEKVLAVLPAARHSVVRGLAGTIRVADFAVTRIVEATVHLLDLAVAVPHVSAPPAEALRRTVDVLTDLSPPVELIRLATGRPAAPVFPVLT